MARSITVTGMFARPPLNPFRRIHVPKDLDAITTIGEESASDGGLDTDQVATIWAAARDLYRAGVHPAIQLCIRRNGVVVLDRTIGHGWGNGPLDNRDSKKVLATPNTPFCIYSASKGITATVIHLLCERGILDLNAPVAEYLPGFGRHGKHRITIAHVLAHRAGVPHVPAGLLAPELLDDRDHRLARLSAMRPVSPPGRVGAYHALTFGFLLAEVVHAATGRTIREVLAEAILDPLGFRWTNYGVTSGDLPLVAPCYPTGLPLLPSLDVLSKWIYGAALDELVEMLNTPRYLTTVLAGTNTVGTANELSRFYEILRAEGDLDGVRVMQPHTIRHALIPQSRLQPDPMMCGWPVRYGYGYMLGAKRLSLFGHDTERAFGTIGLTNNLGWADPERGISAGLITSGKPLVYPEVGRFPKLLSTIASQIPKIRN